MSPNEAAAVQLRFQALQPLNTTNRQPQYLVGIEQWDNREPVGGVAYVVTAPGLMDDTDNDGLPNGWELAYDLDPNNPGDADIDSDGDGMTNLQEYLSGTHPRQPNEPPALQIARQPMNQTALIGGDVTLSVTAIGVSPLSYRWRFNGTNISGATHSTYTIFNTQANDAGTYDVIVSNATGSVTSEPARLILKNMFVIDQDSDGTLTISWPQDQGWILQEAVNILGPWLSSASQVSPVNLRPRDDNRFFRLVKP